jgi:hypothetical protein
MTTNTPLKPAPRNVAFAALVILFAAPCVFAQEVVKADIPFAFQFGGKTMPPGEYEFHIDLAREDVMIYGPGRKTEAITSYITTLSAATHVEATSDAHLVFDKEGEIYTLSEIWRPGGEGILVSAMKVPREHHVVLRVRERATG